MFPAYVEREDNYTQTYDIDVSVMPEVREVNDELAADTILNFQTTIAKHSEAER